MTLHTRTLKSAGLGIHFTDQSTDVLSQWLVGVTGGFLTLVANRTREGIQLGYAVYQRPRPGMACDQLQRSRFLWLADPGVLLTLRSRLVDLGHKDGPHVLPLDRGAPRFALDT